MRSKTRQVLRILLLAALMLGGAFIGYAIATIVPADGLREVAENQKVGTCLGAIFVFIVLAVMELRMKAR